MSVARVLVEERGRVGARSHGEESIVAAKAPAPVGRVPFHAAADVARQRRVIAGDPKTRSRERRQTADPAGGVRYERAVRRQRDHEVAGVVQLVGSLLIARPAAELQVLRDPERARHVALDADDAVDVVGDGGAERVVAEARPVAAAGVERAAAGDEGDFERAGPGTGLLRERRAAAGEGDSENESRDRPFHDCLLVASVATAAGGARAVPRG